MYLGDKLLDSLPTGPVENEMSLAQQENLLIPHEQMALQKSLFKIKSGKFNRN